MMGNIKDRWDSLAPNAKRGLTVLGIVASAMGAVWVVANFTPQPTPKADKQQTVKHILTDTDPRSLGIDGLAAQLKQVAQKHEDLLRRLNSVEEDLKRGRLSDEERLRRMNEEQTKPPRANRIHKVRDRQPETDQGKPAARWQAGSQCHASRAATGRTGNRQS